MTLSPNTRRRVAPAASMVLAVLGALALLVTFVVQVISEAPPSDTGEVRAEILAQLQEHEAGPEADTDFGKVRPDTLEIIDRTSEGVVAYAFLTTTETLGAGVQTSQGGAWALALPGEQTVQLETVSPGTESTKSYDLSVRRLGSGNGYEHTFTAR